MPLISEITEKDQKKTDRNLRTETSFTSCMPVNKPKTNFGKAIVCSQNRTFLVHSGIGRKLEGNSHQQINNGVTHYKEDKTHVTLN